LEFWLLPSLLVAIVMFKNNASARFQWLTPVILATWEAEIERIIVQSQSRQKA
jgi:hypothetical protein